MKKFLKLSTGVVFIITILIAAGCGPAKENEDKNEVEIYIRLAKGANVEKHLEMKDPNNDWVIDYQLYTDVDTGNVVIWILDKNSGIKKIKNIQGDGSKKIFKNEPGKIPFTKKFRLQLTYDLKKDEVEKYFIEFKLPKDKTIYKIDPFLRVRPDPTP